MFNVARNIVAEKG